LLTADPLIDQALVYGDGRPFLAALIVPNFPALANAAAEHGVAQHTHTDLVRDQTVEQLIHDRVEAAMQPVSSPERVRKFLLLDQPFSMQAEELTTTMKLRRRKIVAKYQQQLEQLYAPAPETADS
jgi:long-chain acyl-CoA synthetase